MYNITCGVRVMKTSDCHVTETRYIVPLLDYLFEVAIIARSNVPGARNGTLFSKQGTVEPVLRDDYLWDQNYALDGWPYYAGST